MAQLTSYMQTRRGRLERFVNASILTCHKSLKLW